MSAPFSKMHFLCLFSHCRKIPLVLYKRRVQKDKTAESVQSFQKMIPLNFKTNAFSFTDDTFADFQVMTPSDLQKFKLFKVFSPGFKYGVLLLKKKSFLCNLGELAL